MLFARSRRFVIGGLVLFGVASWLRRTKNKISGFFNGE